MCGWEGVAPASFFWPDFFFKEEKKCPIWTDAGHGGSRVAVHVGWDLVAYAIGGEPQLPLGTEVPAAQASLKGFSRGNVEAFPPKRGWWSSDAMFNCGDSKG